MENIPKIEFDPGFGHDAEEDFSSAIMLVERLKNNIDNEITVSELDYEELVSKIKALEDEQRRLVGTVAPRGVVAQNPFQNFQGREQREIKETPASRVGGMLTQLKETRRRIDDIRSGRDMREAA